MAQSSQKSSGCSLEAITSLDSADSASMTTSGQSIAPTPKCGMGSLHNAGYDDIHTYHSVTQSQAIIYIMVILALYFSALIVLIVRYMRNERNQMRLPYLHPAVLLGKKDRLGPRDRPEADLSHLSTVSTHLNTGSPSNLSPLPQNSPNLLHLQLPLPVQHQPQMDTAV